MMDDNHTPVTEIKPSQPAAGNMPHQSPATPGPVGLPGTGSSAETAGTPGPAGLSGTPGPESSPEKPGQPAWSDPGQSPGPEKNQLLSSRGKDEAEEGQLMQLAAFGTRFWAFVIDLVVIGLLNAIAANLLGIIWGETAWYESYFTANFIFLGITGSLYFVLMTRFYRQTLGKMMMGISVVPKSGQELGWGTVIFRELIGRTLSQLCGSWLGYLVGLFTPRHVTIHDLLADTYVVKEQFSIDRGFVKIPMKH